MDEILLEDLSYGSYIIDYEDGFLSENFRYTSAEFNRLYTRRVRLPDGKGNVIYLMSDTFDHCLNMIRSKDFIMPMTYKKVYYPFYYVSRFANRRILISTKTERQMRTKQIKEAGMVPYMNKTLAASVDNVLFCTSDLVKSMTDVMNQCTVKRNYTEFYPSFVGSLNAMTPKPKKDSKDDNWNNRLLIIDVKSFSFKKGAPVNENKSNPLYLLYLAYLRSRNLSSLNVDMDMLICNKNLFMKFNPKALTDMTMWNSFRRALFRMMDVDLDEYTDSLSEKEKKDIDDIDKSNTLSSIIKDAVSVYTKDASNSAKEVLAAAVEDKIGKKAEKISSMNSELNKAIPDREKVKSGPDDPFTKSMAFMNPIRNPLTDQQKKLFDKISRDYQPLSFSTGIELEDEFTDEDDEYYRPADSGDYDEDEEQEIKKDVDELIFDDDDVAEELINDIQDRNAPMTNLKTAPVNSARDQKLREEQKKKVVKDSTIEEIIRMDSSKVPIESSDKSSVLHTSNRNMHTTTFINANKTYLEKVYTKDILNCFNVLQDKSNPFYITGVEIKDTSDSLNYRETWSVHLVDANKKRSTITVDLPKFQNDRFMYIEGNRWTIQNQNFYNPLVKDTPDTVILTTNYNKITIQRTKTKSLKVVERIFSLIKKTGDSKVFLTGNSSQGNMKYISTFEYDELSKILLKYESNGCVIYFSRDYIQDNIKIPEGGNGDEFFIGTENGQPIFINEDSGLDNQDRTISDIIEQNLPDEYKEIYKGIKGTTQLIYAEGKLAGEYIPVVTTLIVWIGLKKTLDRMEIAWQFHPDMKKVPMSTSATKYMKFADGVLEYESKIFAELILNGLLRMKCNKFKFSDFESEICYDDFIYAEFGSYNGINEIKNFYEFLMDPITIEVCKDFMLPTDAPGLLIHAVKLLADNKHVSKASDQSYRTRSLEQIAGILYGHVANQYKAYVKRGGRIPMTLKRNCVIRSLQDLKTAENYSTLNPVIEVGRMYSISAKGYRGSNSEHSYDDEQKRSYDPSSVGKIAMTTSADRNVGVTRQLVVEPTVSNVRGYRKQVEDLDELKDVNIFSPVEMLTPGSAASDDPIRVAICSKQSQHVVPVVGAAPSLVSNGFDEAVQFHLSDDFVINAEEDGKVIDINDELGFIMVKYKSGKTKAIYTKPEIVKNSGGGFYMSNKLKPVYDKVGQSFKKDEPLAYHPDYFKYSKINGLRYAIGPIVKVAFMSSYNTYEDGGISTEELSEKMATNIVYKDMKGFKRNNNILSMVKVGDHVDIGDPLVKYDVSTEDDELSKLLSKLSETNAEIVSEELSNDLKASHAGTVIDIKVISLLEPETLSPSLGKVVKNYFKNGNDKKKYLDQFDSSEGIMKSGYLLTDSTKPIESKYNMIRGIKGIDVLIEFYIEHKDVMGSGDKVAQFNANKQIVSQCIPKGWEPYSEFRPDEIISSLNSPGTLARRMTVGIIPIVAGFKVLIELKRKVATLNKRAEIEKIIYDVYDALDPTGANTDKYKMLFASMKDPEFNKWIKTITTNPNENFILDTIDNERSLKYEYCEKAAKVLNIPLMEYVYMPHLTMDKKRVIVSKEKCLVGYLNVKRTQQLLAKKNGLSLTNEKRSIMTGQVVDKDKNARDSDIEAAMLISLGADKILQELHGPRSDDLVMKRQMNQSIANKGYVLLDELENVSTNKVTLNMVNTYLLSMMLKSDLVSDTYILPKTSSELFESSDSKYDDGELPYAAFL